MLFDSAVVRKHSQANSKRIDDVPTAKREVTMSLTRLEILQKLSKATTSSGGNNLRDSRGRLAVKRLAFEDGFRGSRFISEFVVVGSSKIPVVSLKTNETLDIAPNPPGSEVSVLQMLEKHESAFGNVKQFILALYGEQEASDQEVMETADEVTKSNAARGMVIDYVTYRKVTDKKQVEIVIPKWYSVEQSADDIQKMRQWMDSLTMGGMGGQAFA